MTVTVPELWIGACIGSLATLAIVAGLLVALARAQKRGKAR